jgi:O-antigen ligase
MSLPLAFSGRSVETGLFRLWLAILLWAPVPLGSNRPWAWSLLEGTIFLVAAAWLVAFACGIVQVTDAFRRARVAVGLLACWVLFEFLYFIPLPPGLVAMASPEAARLHALVNITGVSPNAITLAIDPYAAFTSALKTLSYATAFLLTLLIVNTRERVRTFAFTLVVAGLVLATLGVFLNLTGEKVNWFGYPMYHGDRALATFPNPNHFAGWLEMLIALGIGLLIADLRDRRADSWKKFVKQSIEWILSPKMRLRLILCVLVIALVATRSRMGNTAFFSSLFATGIIGIVLSRHATRGTVILLSSLIAIDVFIVGSWFGVEKLATRLEQTTVQRQEHAGQDSVEDRSAPARLALDLVRDYPVFGTGPGSWYVAFPRYRTGEIASFYADAHNDYAQFLAENGIAGLVLIASFVLSCLVAALRAQWLRRDPLMRGLSFASIMGMISMLIHASVEFNFQIPANALLFMVILALAWISLHLDRRER